MLNCHTYYSFRYGVLAPKTLLELAAEAGYSTLALTEINNTSSCLDFVRRAPSFGIRPVLGIDFRRGMQQLYVALAKNNTGFEEMNRYLSNFLHTKEDIPAEAPNFEHAIVIYPLAQYNGRQLKPHEYIGIAPSDLNNMALRRQELPSKKLVALPTFSFRHKQDHNAHRLLRAVANNTLLSKLPAHEQAWTGHRICTLTQLEEAYKTYPQFLHRSRELLDQCTIEFEFGDDVPHQNRRCYSRNGEEDHRLLRQLCKEGLHYRYPIINNTIERRLEKELDIIEQKGFTAYFLINWDIVQYAQRKNYFYVGRGSGANSIVAYLLRITDVDPIELDLYFERFINLYRRNPPDFDLDFSWKDRDDVTRYIFDRFGNVALLATYSTFQYRAVVRELGKVFGLPKQEIDLLSRGRFSMRTVDELAKLVLRYSQLIQGFPSHLSVHAGGVVLPEKPIHHFTATNLPPKGYPITQFDMVVAEDVGLYKFDILGQRGLAKIKDGLAIAEQNNPNDPRIDIHDMRRFKKDPKIKELLREGQAIGCFYVESPAMRMLLRKLRVDDYLGLVAASSIIRPGVAKSGMMREYILRFRNPERRKDAHPVMLDIMPDTFGVMVYQEDVIKVAHYFAGLTLGEADVLRRGMSGKYRSRSEFQQVKDKFFTNCHAKGYTQELTAEIWRQVESFAGYAFAKGHSASYAVESYQSLFLKAHYPLEYMVATINNFGGFYRTELYVHEARMKGGAIHAPCINTSDYHTIIKGKSIYLGFMHLNELEVRTVEEMLEERDDHGPYQSFEDFLDRVGISLEQVSILIRINAFRFTGENKRKLLWRAHHNLGKGKSIPIRRELFRVDRRVHQLPELISTQHEDAFDQLELLGFPLINPFLLLEEEPTNNLVMADMEKHGGKTKSIIGYLVTVKNTKTSGGKRMNFGTFLDLNGHFIDTTHFPNAARDFPFRGKGIYEITGKVAEEFGFYSLEVSKMEKLAYMQDPRFAETEKQTKNKTAQ